MAARTRSKQLNTELLRQRLKLRSIVSEKELRQKHPTAREFFDKIGLRPGQIRQHAARLLTSGALAGTLLLTSHSGAPIPGHGQKASTNVNAAAIKPGELAQLDLAHSLQTELPPPDEWKLPTKKEAQISQKIQELYGVKAVPELDGNRLNNDYGRMGAEQHLPRYPGDNVWQHEILQDKGITPGLGAWGYFANSQDQMTPELYDTEKWYVAVQTLYLPNWNTDTKRLADWYKYRRVVVVNPANGKVVVAAIADAGPSWWTGKQFGGSPEVMQYLGINYGMQNHPVVLFFLDDPNKEVPLGPLEYNMTQAKKILASKS